MRDLLLEALTDIRRVEDSVQLLSATLMASTEKIGSLEGRLTANDRLMRVFITIIISIVTGLLGLAFVVFQNALHIMLGK